VLDLPDPDRAQLSKSPLDLVVCQIRFDQRENVSSSSKVGFAFQEALRITGEDPWKAEPIEGPPPVNVVITSEGAQQMSTGAPLRGWRFTSSDAAYAVILMADSISVETRRYTRWTNFRATAQRALERLTEMLVPEIEYRVGLRYVDRLHDPSIVEPAGWTTRLQHPLHGLVGHEQIGAAVLMQQQQVILNLGDGAQCRFAHGTLPTDQGLEYVLDYDLYREDARPFDARAVLDVLDLFNTEALQLFQASLTPETVSELR
jgi:uncharacterized protein (TIGR04255 family)